MNGKIYELRLFNEQRFKIELEKILIEYPKAKDSGLVKWQLWMKILYKDRQLKCDKDLNSGFRNK